MPYIAAVTFGFSTRLRLTDPASVDGRNRSTGEPGARFVGSLPIMRRKFARVVVRFDSAVSKLRPPSGELGFRLSDVSARHFADVESVACLFQRLIEHTDVALLNFHDGRITKVVHVNGRGRQQDGLLEHAQPFARGRDLAFRSTCAIARLSTVEQRLGYRRANRARSVGAVEADFAQPPAAEWVCSAAYRCIVCRHSRSPRLSDDSPKAPVARFHRLNEQMRAVHLTED